MFNVKTKIAALVTLGILAGCTSGNSGIEPGFTSVNLGATTKTQFAVGTANINGVAGLNTVATFRQQNGLSATLLNSPKISGPAAFVVPSVSSAGADAGTTNITSSAQALPGTTATASTFGQSGGLFAYGFAPANSTTSGAANFPQFIAATASTPNNVFCKLDPSPVYGTCISANVYAQPFYVASSTKLVYLGGPPAFPYVGDTTYPSGFEGFPVGFTTFAAAPATGTYTLSVNVPSGNTSGFSTTPVSATLNSTALLPTFPTPTLTPDGLGGASIAINVPTGVTEASIYVFDFAYGASGDFSRKNFYTINTTATGAQTLTLPPNLGAFVNGKPSASLASGDFYFVYAAGFDYPAFEAGPPANLQQTPTLVGASGQSDITLSGYSTGTI